MPAYKKSRFIIILFSILAVLCLIRFGLSVICLRNLILLGYLFCLSLTDLESYIIPDSCLIIASAAWVAAIPFEFEKYGTLMGIGIHVASAFVCGGSVLAIALLMDIVLKKESLGGGDIKLIAVMGLYLGMDASLFAMLISCIMGLIFVLIRKGIHPNIEDHFPFGPSIAVSIWIVLMYGDFLIK